MTLPIPPAVLYAGLAGVLLSLIVATAMNGWQCRVFVILALRLAIGWFFLFAGMDKLHSFAVGPSDSNKVFTSAPYFNAAEGPLGDYMRTKYLGDPVAKYTALLAKKKAVTPAEFEKLSVAERAELCPDAAAESLAGDDAEKSNRAKAAYAAWVYGADTRDVKVDLVNGDIPLTADERLAGIALLQKEYDALTAREKEGLNGVHYEKERRKKDKAALRKAKSDLAADASKYVAELRTAIGLPPLPPAEKPLAELDHLTAWTLTLVGAGLLAGLFTKLWSLVGFGFLVMTYLAHPTVPWLPLPPLTAGNPVFVNENIIMALGLLVVLVHPTGRWLGLDALLGRIVFGSGVKAPPPPPTATA